MKKILSLLLLAACLITLAACMESSKATTQVKSGLYMSKANERGPYVYFNRDESTWRSGAGLTMSYAVSGKYQIEGKQITARTDNGMIEIVFDMKSETELKVLSVKCDLVKIDFWIAKDDEFKFKQYEDSASLFDRVCSADKALALSRKSETVVFEGLQCTSGQEIWDSFYKKVSRGNAASVLCAYYYTLDRKSVPEELYEAEKDKYPKLFFYKLEYDGNSFTITTRQSTEKKADYRETFKYLMHYTGDAPAQASYSSYDYYVLVDDNTVTWNNIMGGMLSSRLGDAIKHFPVYQNIIKQPGGK